MFVGSWEVRGDRPSFYVKILNKGRSKRWGVGRPITHSSA